MNLPETAARQLVDDRRATLVGSWRPIIRRRSRRSAEAGAAVVHPAGQPPAVPPGPMSPHELAALVAEFGIGRFERRIGRLVQAARASGVEPLVVEVLADRWAPRAARERALGMVLVALAAPGDQRRRDAGVEVGAA